MLENSGERLLLCKQQNVEIYVDDAEFLTKDQVNGIRFLYAKFKKNIPGVILHKYGASMHKIVVCFLHAIQVLLNMPVLIISNKENGLERWKNLFQNFIGDGVVFESKNIFSKKKIFVNTLKDIALFGRQNWSIAIIDDDSFPKEILRTELKAVYKVWLTSVDLKRDLQNLSLVYSWLYSKKEKFEINFFLANNDICDKINKSILLDAFLEDILISSSSTPDTIEEPLNIKIKAKQTKRRKLKDITGKKIKCTKRQLNDEDLPDVVSDLRSQNETVSFQDKSIELNNTLSKLEVPEPQANNLVCSDDSMESQRLNFDSVLLDLVESEKNITLIDEKNSMLSQKANLETQPSDLSVLSSDGNDKIINIFLESTNEINNENSKIQNNENHSTNTSDSLESKLKDLEEKTLKRFKGSFLDSIF